MRRTERRARTQALDLGLALCCAWYRDLAAIASGADDVVLNTDRLEQLAEDADGLDPANARAAVEWVLDTRRRLRVNVSEELALEALWLRLAAALAPKCEQRTIARWQAGSEGAPRAEATLRGVGREDAGFR